MALTVTGPITITYGGGASGPASTTQAALAAGFVVPVMPVGGTATFSAPVDVTGTVTQSNTATVATPAGTTDPTPANNTSTATTAPVLVADLEIVKTGAAATVPVGVPFTYNIVVTNNGQSKPPGGSNGGTVQVGVPFTYNIVVTNNGPSQADGATVADTLPADFTPTSEAIAPSGGAAGVTGTYGNYTIATFPSGSSVAVSITGTFATPAVGVSNTATVTAPPGVTDPDLTDNTSTFNVDVTAGASCCLAYSNVTVTPNPVPAGANFNVSVQVSETCAAPALAGLAILTGLPGTMTHVGLPGQTWPGLPSLGFHVLSWTLNNSGTGALAVNGAVHTDFPAGACPPDVPLDFNTA